VGEGQGGGWPHRHCSCGTFIAKAPPPVWAPLPNPPPQGGRERTAVVEIATLQLKSEDEVISLPACEKMPLARLETLR